MAKITIAQAQELFKELNVAAEVVADEKEADKDIDLTSITDGAKESIKDEIRPDIEAGIIEKIDKASLGKSLDLVRQQIRQVFGIPRKDLDKLNEREMIELIKSQYTPDDKSKDFEAEKQELINDYESQIEALKTEKETEVSAEKKKYIDRDINAYFVDLASKLNRKEGDLKEHAELLETKFRKQYEIEWDETKGVPVFKQNGAPAKTGTKAFDPQVEASSILEKVGILAKDTRHINPADITNPNPKDKPQVRTGIKQLPIQSPAARAIYEQLNEQ